MEEGIIIKVSGPLVVAEKMSGTRMYDVVRVGEKKLVGEIIELKEDTASIQVYEETAGIGPGEKIYKTNMPLSVELGPGLIESIYDGTQRPLDKIHEISGDYIARGIEVPSLNREKKWHFHPLIKKNDRVSQGDCIGVVKETELVEHKIMVPFNISGTIESINEGDFTVTETIAIIKNNDEKHIIKMIQTWPVRIPRPHAGKIPPKEMLKTGQRIIDTFFPVAKGGTACIPGPFGSGKTVIQHQLAKWADAEIIIYIGCGERGNEMTDVLLEFPELLDPKTGHSLMKRTVLIANTSNMPVAAREASVYTGITIAEYYRDMGYSVALMADSTSRWAEAMREISGRLEEMPGEEGYPAYLSSKIAEFYERAGRVKCLGNGEREGTLSVIGAVSPAGGDLSDPVVQSTLRVVKVFWSLEDKLAFQRHFPAISWLRSYSLYDNVIDNYLSENVDNSFPDLKKRAMTLLEKEEELEEIVRLIGIESLSASDRLIMKTANIIRQDFLHQNAFNDVDTYTAIKKQFLMLDIIMFFHHKLKECIKMNIPFHELESMAVEENISRMKYLPEKDISKFKEMKEDIIKEVKKLQEKEI
jgi:V/A-type H+/Na+-transporting ATPase subunit A